MREGGYQHSTAPKLNIMSGVRTLTKTVTMLLCDHGFLAGNVATMMPGGVACGMARRVFLDRMQKDMWHQSPTMGRSSAVGCPGAAQLVHVHDA